jgi:hypothetical protein
MTIVLDAVEKAVSSDTEDSDLDHLICGCNFDIAVCGTNVSENELRDEGFEDSPDPCVVCEYTTVCPKCGEPI